jgi:hypothetical protein
MKKKTILAALFIFFASNSYALSDAYRNNIYNPGELKPVDSVLKVNVGQKSADFPLKAFSGKGVSLSILHLAKGKFLSINIIFSTGKSRLTGDLWPWDNVA